MANMALFTVAVLAGLLLRYAVAVFIKHLHGVVTVLFTYGKALENAVDDR